MSSSSFSSKTIYSNSGRVSICRRNIVAGCDRPDNNGVSGGGGDGDGEVVTESDYGSVIIYPFHRKFGVPLLTKDCGVKCHLLKTC